MPDAPEKWRSEVNFTTIFSSDVIVASAYAALDGDQFVAASKFVVPGSIQGVAVQIFNPFGELVRSVFPITSVLGVGVPDVAQLSNGNIVVAVDKPFSQSDPSTDISYAILAADGSLRFSGFLNATQGVGGPLGGSQTNPALAAYSLGEIPDRFIAVWEDSTGDGAGDPGIKVRLFQNNGNPVNATEFSINTSTAGVQSQPDVAAVSGGAVVVWTDFGVNAGDIRFAILADSGPTLVETTANSLTAGLQQNPAVATLSDGRFVIVWEDNSHTFDADQGITGRIFNREGTVSVDSFAINATTAGNQSAPHVAAVQDGFVVTFTDPSGGGDVYARTFDSNGNPVGGDVLVNTTVAGSQRADDIIGLDDGRAVVGWVNVPSTHNAAFQIVDAREGDITGDDQNNYIVGADAGQSDPDDRIFGLGGDDKLFGFAGADTIDAGGGDDSVEGGAGADTLIGGPGIDRVNYLLSSAGVTVNLATGTGSGGDAEGDTLSGFEGVGGSPFADTIIGDGGANILNGREGGDVLRGGAGADKFIFDDLAFNDTIRTPPVFDRVLDYNQGNSGSFSAAEGDQIDISLFGGLSTSRPIRLLADPGGSFVDLQLDRGGNDWITIARLNGLHAGDGVNVILSASQPAGVTIKVPGFPATSDFNDDAFSDILLQSAGGETGMWQMNGPSIQSAHNLPPLPAGWNVIGNADFNGDGKSDILLGTPGGALGLWQMNGPTVAAAYDLPTLPTGWHVVGDGDFGGDGKSDILLQSESGGVGMWQMNGGQIAFANDLPPMPQGWHIAGVGDFGGDGKSDIILQSDSGGVGMWQMSGAQITKATDLPPLPSGWSIEDVGDFNADGRSDVLLSTEGGALGLWLMNGASIQSAHDLPALPAGWEVAGLVDVGGDGRSDILLQNGAGGVGLWQMNGPTVQSTHDLPTLPAGWHIAAYQYDLV